MDYHELLTNKAGILAKKAAAEEEVIKDRLVKVTDKIKQGEMINAEAIIQRGMYASEHGNYIEQVVEEKRNIEYHFNLPVVYKAFEREKNSTKLKDQIDTYKVEDLVKRREDKQESARNKQEEVSRDHKDRIRYLQKKDRERDKLVAELKQALNEDNQQFRDINALKKKEQVENQTRSKNFH